MNCRLPTVKAFYYARFQNKNRQEIAETLQVSIKTVDYRIQQSLKILRERLKRLSSCIGYLRFYNIENNFFHSPNLPIFDNAGKRFL